MRGSEKGSHYKKGTVRADIAEDICKATDGSATQESGKTEVSVPGSETSSVVKYQKKLALGDLTNPGHSKEKSSLEDYISAQDVENGANMSA